MKVTLVLPYDFYLDTSIVSLEMDIRKHDLTYRDIIELFTEDMTERVRGSILSDRDIMVVVIVGNKRMDPDEQARDGDRITLMTPLEGG